MDCGENDLGTGRTGRKRNDLVDRIDCSRMTFIHLPLAQWLSAGCCSGSLKCGTNLSQSQNTAARLWSHLQSVSTLPNSRSEMCRQLSRPLALSRRF